MRIPYLPATLSVKLAQHEARPAEGAAAPAAAEPTPLFTYRPLCLTDSLEWGGRMQEAREREGGRPGVVLGELFRDRVVKVDNLTIGDADEPFDVKNAQHMDAIDPGWVTEIAVAILNRAKLSEDAAGK